MESGVGRSDRRGRKRSRSDVNNVIVDGDGKKRILETRSKAYVGRHVMKDFEGSGLFLGKIMSYDSGLYRVEYEDGDCEDLDGGELKEVLIEDADIVGEWLKRKQKLDKLVSSKNVKVEDSKVANEVVSSNGAVNRFEESPISDLRNGGAIEAVDCQLGLDAEDLSSDSCEDDEEQDLLPEVAEPVIPPPELPPSSGNISISEEYIPHLFSVYSFLRSFSTRLFLSPFGLDDFVGSLMCSVPNSLMDSIHVALMRALKCHIEKLSADGSVVASKCTRSIDWSLLDTLTWPVYLLHYLLVMGYVDDHEWKGICSHISKRDYYTLSAGRKLMALQVLCDDVLDFEELKSEIDMRVESEVGVDPDICIPAPLVVTRRGRPPKTTTSKNREIEILENHETKAFSSSNSLGSKANGVEAANDALEDGNGDECHLCGMDGTLLCCDGCPLSYHSRCIGVSKLSIPDGEWFCPECTVNKTQPKITKGTTIKGSEIFGLDLYGQAFMGSCDHLLVLNVSVSLKPCYRYYRQTDVPRVLQALYSNSQHVAMYWDICKGIKQYWDIPDNVFTQDRVDDRNSLGGNSSLNHPYQQENGDIVTNQAGNHIQRDLSSQCKEVREISSVKGQRLSHDGCTFTGSSFKVQGYVNSYLHGDFASSAAASLAVISAEENPVLVSHSSANQRKLVSANISLQIKAFSLAATRFFWPNSEKKLVDVPRERCSWCFSCKAAVTSKRGCLLNAAVSNATKGATKILAGIRAAKSSEGSISSIATYVLLMEESLNGLTEGPFKNVAFRRQWRYKLEGATTCSDIKSLLLIFEENIRAIALSGDWFKFVDGLSMESSVTQTAVTVAGASQKRRPGRRGRKQAVTTEENNVDSQDIVKDVTWWRGGMLSKFVFQRAILQRSLVKKSARQGGLKKIPNIYYIEGPDTSKRSRQLVWRAAVELSRTPSQLALQVRYLDFHVKWSDLVRPEQSPQEGKGPETEASAFRNAFVCEKKIVETDIRYAVAFGSQKHLPSRVLKNIIEVEQSPDGKEKYWFSELRIPLYLIKEYECEVGKTLLLDVQKPVYALLGLKRRRIKTSRKDIFSYLLHKGEIKDNPYSVVCQLDVAIGDVVKCSACEGLCHQQCSVSSTSNTIEEVEFMITCNQCNPTMDLTRSESSYESPTSPLLQIQDSPVAVTAIAKPVHDRSSTSVRKINHSAEVKPAMTSASAAKSKRNLNWGLIRRKKNCEDTGAEFRLKNILLKGNPNMDLDFSNVECYLCHEPYNPELMFIQCETCRKWCHAEALELEESEIFDIMGYKCCRCRRTRNPICPYLNPDSKKGIMGKRLAMPRKRALQQDVAVIDQDSPISEQVNYEIQATYGVSLNEEVASLVDDDSRPYSFSEVEQFTEQLSEMNYELGAATLSCPGPQKLPVRRQTKCEKDIDISFLNSTSELSVPFEGEILNSEEDALANIEWDVSTNGFNGVVHDESLNYEDMEFEPQTYFSFNELLASDEGNLLDDAESSRNVTQKLENTSVLQRDVIPQTLYDHKVCSNSIEPVVNAVMACRFCSRTEPQPDLYCQLCGLCIHSHCSPWVEQLAFEDGWKCGNCRDWR